MRRNFGGGGDDRVSAYTKLYNKKSTPEGQEEERGAAKGLYNLQQRLKNMRMELDLNAASRGVDLGASYFDDDY